MTDPAALFDREVRNWDAAHGPESPRGGEFRARATYLHTLCRRLGRPRVLDLGCGTGRQLLDLAGSIESGIGIDLSPAMIARAHENHARLGDGAEIEFRTGDIAAAAPDTLGQFDLVTFIGALEHVPDPADQLGVAARLMRASGRIVVIMPYPWNLRVWLARWRFNTIPSLRHMTPRQLARLAERFGLVLESVHALPYSPSGGSENRSDRPVLSGAYAAAFA